MSYVVLSLFDALKEETLICKQFLFVHYGKFIHSCGYSNMVDLQIKIMLVTMATLHYL